jgi:hypothetical protein
MSYEREAEKGRVEDMYCSIATIPAGIFKHSKVS